MGTGKIVSVAVDWVGHNLYVADLLGQRIHVVTIDKKTVDGKSERLQATILENIDGTPKDIVVDPAQG